MNRLRFLTAIVVALALAPEAFGQPADDPKVAQVLADWKARQDRFQSVRYIVSGVRTRVQKREIPPELKKKVLPEPLGGTEQRLEFTVLIDFKTGRFRVEETEPVPSLDRDRWVLCSRITAFNGSAHQQAWPRDQNKDSRNAVDSDIDISKGHLGELEAIDSGLWPVLMAHGIVPTVDVPLRTDQLLAAHEPDEFVFRGAVSHAGRRCLSLVTNPTGTVPHLSDEFLVDPGRQSAVLRHVYFQGKNPWFRFDIDYSQTSHGWLPQKWTHTTTAGGKVGSIYRWSVTAVEINVTLREEDFTLPLEPGMLVNLNDYAPPGKGLDVSRPAKGKYRVGVNGDLESLEPRTGFITKEGVQLAPESTTWWFWWALGVSAIALLLATVALRLRRNKARRNDVAK